MATVLTRPTNGVSLGYSHTATAQDATDGSVLIDFQTDYDLAAVVQVLDATGAVATGNAVITFPAPGQVQIADGAAFSITEGQIINVIANRAS